MRARGGAWAPPKVLHNSYTPEHEPLLRAEKWDSTAWSIANMYLGSLGQKGVDGKDVVGVGMNEGDRSFLTTAYFREEDKFADFIVHEAAHTFHNWKRERVGLPEKRKQEWLLPIEYKKRETFAYATASRKERMALADEYATKGHSHDERVNWAELTVLVREASAARNGWKRILAACKAEIPAQG